jgi:hypothetical protein
MSLGNIFRTIAPIAAGAMFGPGGAALAGSATAGTAGTAIAAGALTGAGIAALSGDDPLMGAVSGGLGGYSGSGIGKAMSGTAAVAPTKTAIPSGMVDRAAANTALKNAGIKASVTPEVGGMVNVPMPNKIPESTFLSRLGGGSKLMGAGKLGAAGLPVIGAAAMPDYSQTEDPMAKYDPNRKLNLNMTTGIKNALMRDSGVRLLAQGGYIQDRMYPEGFVDEYGMPKAFTFSDLTDEEIEYMFGDYNTPEAIERANIDMDHKIKMQKYIDEYDRNMGMAQGGYLETDMGDGMSDEIPASLDGEQDVLLSENEFVIPADVVSGLGNGSSDAGAEQLYAMMDRVRKARTGTEKMGKEVNAERLMPA